MPYFVVLIILILSSIGLDQFTKLTIIHNLDVGEGVPLIDGIIELVHVKNEGMAFGLLSDQRWIFITISTIGILAIGFYLFRVSTDNRITKAGLALIIGGGIGNMIDRCLPPFKVTDMIELTFMGDLFPWVFNIADMCVCIGVGVAVLGLVLDIIKEYRLKHPKETGDDDFDS
jgi:signal peptidase II